MLQLEEGVQNLCKDTVRGLQVSRAESHRSSGKGLVHRGCKRGLDGKAVIREASELGELG